MILETELGRIEYCEEKRIKRSANQVYKGVYLDGLHAGKEIILKYTDKPGEEAGIIEAIARIGIKTPQVLDQTEKYMILEYKNTENLDKQLSKIKISSEQIGIELAKFHAVLYNNKTSLEGMTIDTRTEKKRIKQKVSELTKEHIMSAALKAILSGFMSRYLKNSFNDELETLLSQIPEDECIGHRDLTPENIITDGQNFYFIDFRLLGKTSFANEVANFVLNLKDTKDFAEKEFIDAYYEELNKQIGDKINKTKEQFLKEYTVATIITSLALTFTTVKCGKDPNRQSKAKRLDGIISSAFDKMSKEQRQIAEDVAFNYVHDNEYSKKLGKSIQNWRKKNQTPTKRVQEDVYRSVERLALLMTAAAFLAAGGVRGWYLVRDHQELVDRQEKLTRLESRLYANPKEPIANLRKKLHALCQKIHYENLSPEDRDFYNATYNAAEREVRFAEEHKEWSKKVMIMFNRLDSFVKRVDSFNSKHRITRKQSR